MYTNWLPGSRDRNRGNIFILSIRKVVLWVCVIFVYICSNLSNCHFDDKDVNKCAICHIPNFCSSLNGSFVAAEPYWLISRVKNCSLIPNLVECCCFVWTVGVKAPALSLVVSSRTVLYLNGRYFSPNSSIELSVSGLISSKGKGA